MEVRLCEACEKTRAQLFVTLSKKLAVKCEVLGVGCVSLKQRPDVFGVVGVQLRLYNGESGGT